MTRALALLFGLGLLVSCRSIVPATRSRDADVRLLVESSAPDATDWVLPQSGVHIRCAPKPIIASGDIAAMDVVTLELGKAVLVQLTPLGTRILADQGQALAQHRLVLVIHGRAVGTVRLDQPVQDGRMVIFVEVPDSDLAALVHSVQRGLHRSWP